MNEVIKSIISRQSVKKYKPTMVPEELIASICEAGTYAPTGMGRQSPIIIAVTNKEMRDKLSDMNLQVIRSKGMHTSSGDADPFYGAPVVLIVLAKRDVPTHVYDGTLVMENLLLAAHSLGLGACWIHRAKEMFDSEEGKQILRSLGITEDYEGIGHCIVGYPDVDTPRPQKPRKPDYVKWVR